MSKEHDRIWLEPAGAPDRCWCQDNQWGDDGIEYVRADLAATEASKEHAPQAQDDRKVVVTTDEVAEALTYALEIIETKEQRIANLESALEWYGEQSRLVRLIHNEGDKGRQALADDGGRRDRAILSATPSHPMKEED